MKPVSIFALCLTLLVMTSWKGLAQCNPDTAPPVLSGVPADTTAQCMALPPPADVTATDFCDADPAVTLAIEFQPSDPGSVILIRTWTATDSAGNSASDLQEITVIDSTNPVIECPDDMSVDCLSDAGVVDNAEATAKDNCGPVEVTHRDELVPGDTCRIEREWTATDQCGNASSCVQAFTITDSTPPDITCPENKRFECPADTGVDATGKATATDNCENVEIDHSDTAVSGCGATVSIRRTWTATDDCGNASDCVQSIEVVNTILPVITCPDDMTLECPADTGVGANGEATTEDACGDISISQSDSVAPGCSNTGVVTRTWTAMDGCENASSCIQTITVEDTTPPEITCPDDVTLECPAETIPEATGKAEASDDCADVTVSHRDIAEPGCGEAHTIKRHWLATDACGDTAVCIQTITVVDTTAPRIDCPTDVALECPAETSPEACGKAEASDDCADVTMRYRDISEPGCGETETITRIWTAGDECGNTSSCVQTITVVDATPPDIQCNAADVITFAAIDDGGSGSDYPDTDCQGQDYSGYEDWIGDGVCDDGTWGPYFNCDDFNCDEGDCDCDDTEPVSFTATATDSCGGVSVEIIGFECFPPDDDSNASDDDESDCIAEVHEATITISKTGPPGTIIQWRVVAVDECGNEASNVCEITVLRPPDNGL